MRSESTKLKSDYDFTTVFVPVTYLFLMRLLETVVE
nr:hypothetical protein [Tanacetum cinerariifolium]